MVGRLVGERAAAAASAAAATAAPERSCPAEDPWRARSDAAPPAIPLGKSAFDAAIQSGRDCRAAPSSIEFHGLCAKDAPPLRTLADAGRVLGSGTVPAVLIGDSFSMALQLAACVAGEAAGGDGIAVVSGSACGPFFGVPWDQWAARMAVHNPKNARRFLPACRICHRAWRVLSAELRQPTLFVMAAAWSKYANVYSPDEQAVLTGSLDTTIRRLCAEGHTVVIVGEPPNAEYRGGLDDPIVCVARPPVSGRPCKAKAPASGKIVDTGAVLRRVAEAAGAEYMDLVPLFCNANVTECDLIRHGVALYRDLHVTNDAGTLLHVAFTDVFTRHQQRLAAWRKKRQPPFGEAGGGDRPDHGWKK